MADENRDCFECGVLEMLEIIERLYHYSHWDKKEKEYFFEAITKVYSGNTKVIDRSMLFSSRVCYALQIVSAAKDKGISQEAWIRKLEDK